MSICLHRLLVSLYITWRTSGVWTIHLSKLQKEAEVYKEILDQKTTKCETISLFLLNHSAFLLLTHKSYHHKCRRNTVNFWTHFRSPWHITITGPSESWFKYVSVLSCLFWTQYQQLATMLIFPFSFFQAFSFFAVILTI